jgi:glutathione peroxidase
MGYLFSMFFFVVSIYTYNIRTLSASTVNLSTMTNKKIMIVNAGSSSQYAGQLEQLEQLYQQHKDSLEIIVFPSNSFDNEPLSNAELSHLFYDSLQVHYKVAEKANVTHPNIHPLYRWLTFPSLNGGGRSGEIKADFTKILIDRNGKIYAYFNSRVSPLDSMIQQAIAMPANN